MKHGDRMPEAARLLEAGLGEEAIASIVGVSRNTARKWVYAYRALGKEALLSGKRRTYSQSEKLEAVRLFLDEGATKSEVMQRMGIKSVTALERWVRDYRAGGAEALTPRPKGRRPNPARPAFASREEELEARVRELELELEIQKRINALADEIERKSHRR